MNCSRRDESCLCSLEASRPKLVPVAIKEICKPLFGHSVNRVILGLTSTFLTNFLRQEGGLNHGPKIY